VCARTVLEQTHLFKCLLYGSLLQVISIACTVLHSGIDCQKISLTFVHLTKIFSMISSLCWYTFYAENCGGLLESTHQAAVGAILVDPHASFDM